MGEWLKKERATLKSVVAVAGGTLGAQAIALAALPVVSRLYSPDDYGVYAYLLGLTALAVSFASLRFEAGVPLASSEQQVNALVRLALSTLTVICVSALALVLAFDATVEDVAGSAVSSWLWLLPLLVWVTGCFSILSQLVVRARDYGTIASRGVIASGLTAAVQVLWPWSRSAGGLIAGPIFGRAGASVLMAHRHREQLFVRLQPGSIRAAARTFWRLPVAFAPSAALNALGTQLPLLVVARMFGPEETGQFGMALQIVGVPAALLGVAFSQVFLGEFTVRQRDGLEIGRAVFLAASRRLLLPAVVASFVLIAIVPPLVPLLLGETWADAGDFVRVMGATAGIALLVSPLSQVFLIYQEAAWNVMLDIARVVIVLLAAVLSLRLSLSPSGSVLMMYAGLAFVYLAIWLGALRVVSQRPSFNA